MSMFLVTGGAGFIGRHVCEELLGAGHQVRVVDSLVEQAHGTTGRTQISPDIDFIEGDLRDAAVVSRALDGVEGVFHLAAEVGVGQSMYEVERYVSANDLGTAVLLEQMIGQPVKRVVVASSMSIYGEGLYRSDAGGVIDCARRSADDLRGGNWEPTGPDGAVLRPVPTDESKRPDLASVYALTKYAQEQMTMIMGPAYGMEVVALRLFNVFGPGQMLSNPYTGVLAIFAGRLLNGQPPMVFEDGRQRRDFVHVQDIARAFRLAMEVPEAKGEIINIGSGRSYAVDDIARLLANAMDREDLEPRILHKSRTGDIRHCFADIGKARRLLGFEPRLSLETTVLDLVEWVSRQQANDRVQQAHEELEQRGLVV